MLIAGEDGSTSQVEVGEPLLFSVKLKNVGSTSKVLPTDDNDELQLEIAGVDEDTLEQQARPASSFQTYATFTTYDILKPGEVKDFIAVCALTARLRLEGQYTLTVVYRPLNISAQLPFVVKSANRHNLQSKAFQFGEQARTSVGPQAFTYVDALASIEPHLSEPVLCDLVKRSHDLYTPVYRLAEMGTPALYCLLQAEESLGQGLGKEVIVNVLKAKSADIKDPHLLKAIEQSLGKPTK